jgi:hypothetical protein
MILIRQFVEIKMLTTLGVMALPYLDRPLDAQVVGWACQMLERGYDGENLRILASLSAPLNEFELADYLQRTFDEQGIPVLSEAKLLDSYVFELLSASHETPASIRDLLQSISLLCVKNGYPHDYFKLYLLYHAIDSLIEYGVQHYIDGVNLEDVPTLVREQAELFRSRSVELPFY